MANIVDTCRGQSWVVVRDAGRLGELLEAFGGKVSGMCNAMGWERTGGLRAACKRLKGIYDGQAGDDERAEVIECQNRQLEDPNLIVKLWAAADAAEAATIASNIEQDVAEFTIKGDLPVGICSIGDTHIGADSVNGADLRRTLQAIADEPGLYCVLNGDLIDGFVSATPDTGRFAQSLRPRFQKQLAVHVCEMLAPKVIALCSGQHEFFSVRLDDFDFGEYLAKHARAVYLGPGGSAHLRFRDTDVRYSLGVWHKYKGSSINDETARAKRLYRDHGPFDVTLVADKHSPAASCEIRNSEMRAFLCGGTWKLRDDYSKSLGFLNSRVAVPMVILWPNEKRFWVTVDFHEGLRYLRTLREEARRGIITAPAPAVTEVA